MESSALGCMFCKAFFNWCQPRIMKCDNQMQIIYMYEAE